MSQHYPERMIVFHPQIINPSIHICTTPTHRGAKASQYRPAQCRKANLLANELLIDWGSWGQRHPGSERSRLWIRYPSIHLQLRHCEDENDGTKDSYQLRTVWEPIPD